LRTKGSYIFAIELVLLVGIQLFQPTSAQEFPNATRNATNVYLPENISNPTRVVNSTTIINSLFDSNLPYAFIIIIFLIIIIPLVFDMNISYKRRSQEGAGKDGGRRIQGMPGVYRSLMKFWYYTISWNSYILSSCPNYFKE
jgi:hypothetical protein